MIWSSIISFTIPTFHPQSSKNHIIQLPNQSFLLAGNSFPSNPLNSLKMLSDPLSSMPKVKKEEELEEGEEEEDDGRWEKKRLVIRRSLRVRKKPNQTTTTNIITPKSKKNQTNFVVGDIEDFPDEQILGKIRASLLEWYDQNQRVLPWRKKRTEDEDKDKEKASKRAYAVWVSEIMLQQTRVSTVIDYFNRWMDKWPTLHHLAQASQEEVNDLWAGLGYYRRARFLLEGAKMVVEGGGEFPRTVAALRKVRGIGDYTAGAIASIAFNEAVPVVDGNVVRVIARLKAISANPKESETIKNLWRLAGKLVDPHRPGDFNQALMELGAVICTPTSPTCSACPISEQCRAFSLSAISQSAQVTDYPIKVAKPKQRHEFSAVCVVEILEDQKGISNSMNNRYLLVKRPEEGLLAGLWEFPSVLVDEEVDSVMRRKVMDEFLKKSFKLDISKCSILLREDVGDFVHIFSHIRLRMYVELLTVSLKGGSRILSEKENKGTIVWKCVDSEAIQGLGLTSGVRKVYNMIKTFKQKSLPINPGSRKRKSTSTK